MRLANQPKMRLWLTEVHREGVYYIEWRENSRRLRQAIPNRNEVLDHARLKAVELDARKAGIESKLRSRRARR